MKGLLSVLLISVLCACAFNRKVDLQPRSLPEGAVQFIKPGKPIVLANVSEKTDDARLTKCAVDLYIVGRLYAFTETYIGTAKDALSRSGVVVENNADKSIAIAVTSIGCVNRSTSAKTTVNISVRTGDGYSTTITGEAAVSNIVYGASGAYEEAIMDGVTKMLKDNNVISYVEK